MLSVVSLSSTVPCPGYRTSLALLDDFVESQGVEHSFVGTTTTFVLLGPVEEQTHPLVACIVVVEVEVEPGPHLLPDPNIDWVGPLDGLSIG